MDYFDLSNYTTEDSSEHMRFDDIPEWMKRLALVAAIEEPLSDAQIKAAIEWIYSPASADD